MIHVLIKAPTPVLRAGLKSLVRTYASVDVIDESPDEIGSSQSDLVDLQPDVILAELDGRDDESAREVLDAADSGIPVILLIHGAISEWADVLTQGVRALLPNNSTGPQIAAAIEAVAAGLVVLYPAEMESVFHSEKLREFPEALPEALTAREIEVLRSMAEGLGNREIASRLRISEHTVKFHVASIMGKLGAGSRTQAVMLGIRHGIVFI
jgi:DNA-binding NarL/FixJ family response regulator